MKPEDHEEYRHEPDGSQTWQENYVFHAFDPSTRSGFYFHLGYIHSEGLVDVRAMTIIDGEVTSVTVQTVGNDALLAPGVSVEVHVPYDQLALRFDGTGHTGPDDVGWFGRIPGETPFGFEVDVRGGHPPLFFDGLADQAGLDPRMAGNHYEQGGSWTGRLWAGDRSIETAGLLVRDHSWGPREWHFDQVLWAPMVFDDGRRLISTLLVLSGGRWHGFSVESDDHGRGPVTFDPWIRSEGPLAPRQFSGARLLRWDLEEPESYTFDGLIHLPFQRHASFADEGASRGLSDMYSTVDGPRGRGFGTIQFATTGSDVRDGLVQERAMVREGAAG